jgi:hypothetical protein
MKPDATLKPDLTLEHALAEAVAKRLTDGHAWAIECRVLAYQAALEGFRLGVATSAQLLAELAAADGSESLRHAEQQVRALPDDLA